MNTPALEDGETLASALFASDDRIESANVFQEHGQTYVRALYLEDSADEDQRDYVVVDTSNGFELKTL